MRQSDSAFVVTILVGFVWGWLMKALNEWGKRKDAEARAERHWRNEYRIEQWQRHNHPSWGDHDQ